MLTKQLRYLPLVFSCHILWQIRPWCEASERKRLHVSVADSKIDQSTSTNNLISYQAASELLTWDGQDTTPQSEASTVGIASSVSAATFFNAETNAVYSSFQSLGSNPNNKNADRNPILICNSMANVSGYNRTNQVCSLLNITEADCASVTTSVSNTIDTSCSIFQTTIDAVESAAGNNSNLVFLPLVPSLKMRKGLVDAITTENATQFNVDLCDMNSTAESVFNNLNVQLFQKGTNKNQAARSLLSKILLDDRRKREDTWNENPRYLRVKYSETNFSRRLTVLRRSLAVLNSTQCITVYKGLSMSSSARFNSFTIQISNADSEVTSSFLPLCILNVVQLLATDPRVGSINYIPKILLSATSDQNIGPNNDIWITQSNIQNFRPWFQAGLTGSGQVIGVSDSGIDTDNCYFANADGSSVIKDGSIYPNNRKIIQYYPFVDGLDGNEGHGTAVAATIVGKRYSGQGMADGIAPDAKISFFDIGNDSDPSNSQCCSIPPDISLFLNKARSAGAKIQNISWGTTATNEYISLDQALDDFLYNDQDSIIIVAAGNSGPGANTVVSPALAKNVITVGSHHGAGNDLYPGQYGRNYLAFFSSNGPSADSRVKPDVVAPGLSVLSARALPLQTGECDPSGITLTAGQAIDGVNYRYGTSFSAPAVTANAALIRQYFMEGFYPTGSRSSSNMFLPSGQLIKAVILNGAQPLAGYQPYNNGFQTPVPLSSGSLGYDNQQGYGRVILQTSLALSYSGVRMKNIVFDRVQISDYQVHQIFITIDSTNCDSKDFSVTISWADPPAVDGCTSCSLNDLDLTVSTTSGSQTYYGNGGTTKDYKNNVERVRISKVFDGDLTVTIAASNLATSTQNYSLVMAGCPIYKSRSGFNGQSLCPCPPYITCYYSCPQPSG